MPGINPAGQVRADPGFTLLEVLVALALTASVLVSLLALGNYQRLGEQNLKARAEIISQAEMLLNQWLSAPCLEPGQYKEDLGGGRIWTVKVKNLSPLVSAKTNSPNDLLGRVGLLWQVEVCCNWRLLDKGNKFCFQGVSITPPRHGGV